MSALIRFSDNYVLSRRSKTFALFRLYAPPPPPDISPHVYKPTQNCL